MPTVLVAFGAPASRWSWAFTPGGEERRVTYAREATTGSRLLELWLGLFALAALVLLLGAGWLRSFLPAARPPRLRDDLNLLPGR